MGSRRKHAGSNNQDGLADYPRTMEAGAGDGRSAMIGIAGLDRVEMTNQARMGLGSLDRAAMVGIAGCNTHPIQQAAQLGVAGNLGGGARLTASREIVGPTSFMRRDEALSSVSKCSNGIGDQAARSAWRSGVWFADAFYIVRKGPGTVEWREGRKQIFGREYRDLPLLIDSSGYRREISGIAARWTHDFDLYPQAIDLLDPDGYAAWDYPTDREKTLQALRALMSIYPQDVGSGRMWPIYSARWCWDDNAHQMYSENPKWVGRNLASAIPLTRTQRAFKESTREVWARVAIANALKSAQDPDFRWMAETFGQVMIGGLIGSACPRMVRHLYLGTLYHLFPGLKIWALGQASAVVTNGLLRYGLLDRISLDGSWWIRDSTAGRMAVLEDGLITMLSFESNYRIQPFFTTVEMMAANLRSLLSAFAGLINWPPPVPLPTDLMDLEQALELKRRLQYAQLELGIPA